MKSWWLWMRSNSPPLVPIRLEQGFAETANHFGGIVAVKKEGADAVLSHRADAVSEDQPSGIGLDGRSAIPHLDQFLGKSRFEEQRAFVPVVDVVGEGTRTIRPRRASRLPAPYRRALLAVGKPRPFRSRMAHSFSTVGCVNTVSSRSQQGGWFAWVEGLRAAAVGVVQQWLGWDGRFDGQASRLHFRIDFTLLSTPVENSPFRRLKIPQPPAAPSKWW
jgi:hypothetical protein